MWQFLFSTLRRRRGNAILASGGFFLAACTLILLTATTQGTVVRANQIISQNWRPIYDLAVLPAQAQIPQGKSLPADFIAGNGGGISMDQYKQIQQLPGVEVAAPVAYLGYVQIPSPEMGFAPDRLPSGYYQVDWTLSASNGKQSLVERHESFVYDVAASCPDNTNLPLMNALAKNHIFQSITNCGFNGGSAPQVFQSIDTGPFLLTAIDPTAENQLVHLNQHITNGRMLTNQDTVQQDPNSASFYQVPLLLQEQLQEQTTLHVSINKDGIKLIMTSTALYVKAV